MSPPTPIRDHHLSLMSTSATPPPPRKSPPDESSSLTRSLGVVTAMLATLDTLTAAGQRHTMEKVVAFMETQRERASRKLRLRDYCLFQEILLCAARESDPARPDVLAFRHHSERLIALLASTT